MNWSSPDKGPQWVYISYLLGWILIISPVVGLIWAYLQKSSASATAQTHYHFAIRTFWMGLGLSLAAGILSVITFGLLSFLFLPLSLWIIVRMVKGLLIFNRGEMHPNPKTWWIG